MKHLYLLRHAKSDWDDPGQDDIDRPLAARGRRAAALMARHIATLTRPGAVPLGIDRVLVSTAVRARQTFDALCPVFDGVPVGFERRLYTFSAAHLLDRLRAVPDDVGSMLVIGHNPALHEAAVALTAHQEDAAALANLREKFPTAALARLDCAIDRWADLNPDIHAGTVTLTAFVRPRDLEP